MEFLLNFLNKILFFSHLVYYFNICAIFKITCEDITEIIIGLFIYFIGLNFNYIYFRNTRILMWLTKNVIVVLFTFGCHKYSSRINVFLISKLLTSELSCNCARMSLQSKGFLPESSEQVHFESICRVQRQLYSVRSDKCDFWPFPQFKQ